MWKIILSFLIPLILILAAPLLPSTSCSVNWLDSNLERFEGLFPLCTGNWRSAQSYVPILHALVPKSIGSLAANIPNPPDFRA